MSSVIGEDPLLEHRPHLVREPVIQFGATAGVGDKLDAEADFRERHRADIEQIERLRGDEGDHFGLGFRTAQLGQDIGVEQPARHRVDVAHRHARAPRLDVDVAIRRGLHGGDERLTGLARP